MDENNFDWEFDPDIDLDREMFHIPTGEEILKKADSILPLFDQLIAEVDAYEDMIRMDELIEKETIAYFLGFGGDPITERMIETVLLVI